MDEAKEDMVDVVKFLQNPEAFEQVGAKIPKGQEKVNVNIEMLLVLDQCKYQYTFKYILDHGDCTAKRRLQRAW